MHWHHHKSTSKWSPIWEDTNLQLRLINKLKKTPSSQPFSIGFSWYAWEILPLNSLKPQSYQFKQSKNYSLIIMACSCRTLKIHSLTKLSNSLEWKSNSKKKSKYQSKSFLRNLDNFSHMFKNISKIIIWPSFMQVKNISEFFIISNQKFWPKMLFF